MIDRFRRLRALYNELPGTIVKALQFETEQRKRQLACPVDECPDWVFATCSKFSDDVACLQRIEFEFEIREFERQRLPCALAPCSGYIKGPEPGEWIFTPGFTDCVETAEEGCQIKLDRQQ